MSKMFSFLAFILMILQYHLSLRNSILKILIRTNLLILIKWAWFAWLACRWVMQSRYEFQINMWVWMKLTLIKKWRILLQVMTWTTSSLRSQRYRELSHSFFSRKILDEWIHFQIKKQSDFAVSKEKAVEQECKLWRWVKW